MDEITRERRLNAAQVAELLNVHLTTVHRWAKNGTLKSIRIGKEYRFRESYIESMLNADLEED